MDDSWYLKQLSYEKRSGKFKFIKQYEFSNENRDILQHKIDFETTQVTSMGVYKNMNYIPFYDQSNYNKDLSLIKSE